MSLVRRVGTRVLRAAAVVAVAVLALPIMLVAWCFWSAAYVLCSVGVILTGPRTLFRYSEERGEHESPEHPAPENGAARAPPSGDLRAEEKTA